MSAPKAGLPPIARPDARLFLLGSLPGDASLAAQRYYAHPTNQFWRLLGQAIGEDLHGVRYEKRLERLRARRIALWDVVASATRPGSLDQAIGDAQHNEIAHLLTNYRDLRAVGFNGSASAAIGRKLIGNQVELGLIDLPSSSAANTTPFAEKARAWSVLGQILQD